MSPIDESYVKGIINKFLECYNNYNSPGNSCDLEDLKKYTEELLSFPQKIREQESGLNAKIEELLLKEVIVLNRGLINPLDPATQELWRKKYSPDFFHGRL